MREIVHGGARTAAKGQSRAIRRKLHVSRTTSETDRHVTSMLRKRKIASGKAVILLGKSGKYIKKRARDGVPVLETGDP